MYLFIDEWGKQRYANAKIGGFKRSNAALAAINRRTKVGYVTDSNNNLLYAVRNGMKII
jgi:hypothetical protein